MNSLIQFFSDLFLLERLFLWNHIILISWFGLIVAPKARITRYLTLIPPLLLAVVYTALLFIVVAQAGPDTPRPDFFSLDSLDSLDGWMVLLKDPYMVLGTTIHWSVLGLVGGIWISSDFYERFTVGETRWGRIYFTGLLLVAYLVAPVGFLLYWLSTWLIFRHFPTQGERNREEAENLAPVPKRRNPLLDSRVVELGARLPNGLRQIYYILLLLVGLVMGVVFLATTFLVLWPICAIDTLLFHRFRARSRPGVAPPRLSEAKPSRFIPAFVRNRTADYRLTLITTKPGRRGPWWKLRFYVLQFACVLEYIPNATSPLVLFTALTNEFGGELFPFGDGLGVSTHQAVVKHMSDPQVRKGPESLGWAVSTSQATFSSMATTFLSSGGDQERLVQIGRSMVRAWLSNFPHQVSALGNDPVAHTVIGTLMPWKRDALPPTATVYGAVGDLMFYLATDGQFTKTERSAYLECVNNPAIFFPDWFNMILGGRAKERKGLDGYYTIRAAFARYPTSPAFIEVMDIARKENIEESEALRLLAFVFSIAGAAVPAKLAVTVITRLYDDPERFVPMFDADPSSFIRECARLDKSVPMVSVFSSSDEELVIGGAKRIVPANTPMHLSVVSANRDPAVFGPTANDFDPTRAELAQQVTWNGLEQAIMSTTPGTQPPRFCPGHNFSINVVREVVERFKPDIAKCRARVSTAVSDSEFGRYRKMLDLYTVMVIKLMDKATLWNHNQARGPDMVQPTVPVPVSKLKMRLLDLNVEIPTWDEDEPAGDNAPRVIARWLINSDFMPFFDIDTPWTSESDAIAFRERIFGHMPPASVEFTDMVSDAAMTRLAFYGMACHYTRKVDASDVICPEGAVYTNDVTALYSFKVRPPYERYGAAAFFDADYRIVAIYWSHGQELVTPGGPNWEHAKWAWKTSFFALVTIRDHLLVAHLTESNSLATATRGRLPANHPLRLFLKPFEFRTVSVNSQAASSLVNNRGLVHRIWAFGHDEFLRVVAFCNINYKFTLLPDFIHPSMREEPDSRFPIHRDANAFWQAIRRYVDGFVHELFPHPRALFEDPDILGWIDEVCVSVGHPGINDPEHFIDLLTQLIVNGTGLHRHVGQVSDYMLMPTWVGCKLEKGKQIQSVQTYTQVCVLTTVTGLKMPRLLDDWQQLLAEFGQHRPRIEELYTQLKTDLFAIQADIETRNRESRTFPFRSFQPDQLASSLST